MSTPIEGKVAAVIDDTTLVLTSVVSRASRRAWPLPLFALHGEIEDPDSGQPLGRWEVVKARVVATHVQAPPVYSACSGRTVGEAPVVGDTRPLSAMMVEHLGGPRPRPRAVAAIRGAGGRCPGAAPEPAHCRGRRSAVASGGRGRCERPNRLGPRWPRSASGGCAYYSTSGGLPGRHPQHWHPRGRQPDLGVCRGRAPD